jgi:4-amino-4-deoxy-L-arabinose transferase-like glycosyltransferase
MILKYRMRLSVALAALAGLGLRLLFVLKFPATNSGDAPFYIELAWNWLKKGVYGMTIDGQLTPVDMRVPGYPAFLAAVFGLAGNSERAAMLAHIAVDMATCFVVTLIAVRLAKPDSRRRVGLAAFVMAALCPFTANYNAVVLTETLVTFLTALTLIVLLETDAGAANGDTNGNSGTSRKPWFFAGVLAGFGALVRPETPLILGAVGLVLAAKWWRPADWMKLARAGVLMAVGLAVPLIPWAARNWYVLHEVRFLAPRYSELPGEVVPRGFTAWTNTWLWRMRDVYLVTWNLNSVEISMDDIPSTAFDSDDERDRIGALLDEHNDTLTETDEMDAKFGEIARERTARHPLRTYAKIPFLRCLALWFTPRVELLPLGGHLTPLKLEWEEDRPDFESTLALVVVNGIFVLLALIGLLRAGARPGVALLVTFVILRTLFFAYFVDTPEPRYVLECFPAVIALGALAFELRGQRSSTGSG